MDRLSLGALGLLIFTIACSSDSKTNELAIVSGSAKNISKASVKRTKNQSIEQMRNMPDLRLPLGKPLGSKILGRARTMSYMELGLLRRSVLAQYGKTFEQKWVQNYFDSRSWYRPHNRFRLSQVAEQDLENMDLILQMEELFYESEEWDGIETTDQFRKVLQILTNVDDARKHARQGSLQAVVYKPQGEILCSLCANGRFVYEQNFFESNVKFKGTYRVTGGGIIFRPDKKYGHQATRFKDGKLTADQVPWTVSYTGNCQ